MKTLNNLADEIYAQLVAIGVHEDVAKAFVCLRFHPHCAWGLGKIDLNNVETYTIVRPIESDNAENVEAVFVATQKDMTCFSNLRGIEQIPEKSKLN